MHTSLLFCILILGCGFLKGLIIKEKWLDKIFNENKIWEIRGNNTKIRGKVYLIQSGSGLIVGECEIIDSIKLSVDDYYKSECYHKIDTEIIKYPYKTTYAWKLSNIKKYQKPLPYQHPRGAVIWVNIIE
ncbi:ASCH domain-containing protein [Sutterella wadsworthensis]|uniref:ASCH domain-containing protein n=1 Tax=Sutterella wadsworthensis TaxID=40545 RepID=UPI0032BFFB28